MSVCGFWSSWPRIRCRWKEMLKKVLSSLKWTPGRERYLETALVLMSTSIN